MGEIVYNMSPVTVGERFPKDSVQHDIARSLVLIYHILFSYYFDSFRLSIFFKLVKELPECQEHLELCCFSSLELDAKL